MMKMAKGIVGGVVLCVVLMGAGGCGSQAQPSADKGWIWQHVSAPDEDTDGFVHLAEAVKRYEADGGKLDQAYSHLLLASNAKEWSGRMVFTRLEVTGDRFLEALVSDRGIRIEFSELRDVLRALVAFADEAERPGSDVLKPDVGRLLIRLGYQMSRNGEDNLLGVLRLTVWEEGSGILHRTGGLDEQDYEKIRAELKDELNDIRRRNPNKTYHPIYE